MIDLYFFKIDVPTFILIVSAIVFLTAQLLLCFKVRCVWLRLIPAILSFVPTLVFFILMVTMQGWDAIGYMILMLMSATVLGVCALGWGIWVIALLIQRRKRK